MKITVLMCALVMNMISVYGMEEGASEKPMPVNKSHTFTDDDYTKFCTAIKAGDTTTMTDYMNQGIKLNHDITVFGSNQTPLELAVTTNRKSAEFLSKIVVERTNSDLGAYNGAFTRAAYSEDCERFKYLLRSAPEEALASGCHQGLLVAYHHNKLAMARLILPQYCDSINKGTRFYLFGAMTGDKGERKDITDLILAHPKAVADLETLTNENHIYLQPNTYQHGYDLNKLYRYRELLNRAKKIAIEKALDAAYQNNNSGWLQRIFQKYSDIIETPCSSREFTSYMQLLANDDLGLHNQIIDTVIRHPKAIPDLEHALKNIIVDYPDEKECIPMLQKYKYLLQTAKNLQ